MGAHIGNVFSMLAHIARIVTTEKLYDGNIHIHEFYINSSIGFN